MAVIIRPSDLCVLCVVGLFSAIGIIGCVRSMHGGLFSSESTSAQSVPGGFPSRYLGNVMCKERIFIDLVTESSRSQPAWLSTSLQIHMCDCKLLKSYSSHLTLNTLKLLQVCSHTSCDCKPVKSLPFFEFLSDSCFTAIFLIQMIYYLQTKNVLDCCLSIQSGFLSGCSVQS